jgi:hypothetical protein
MLIDSAVLRLVGTGAMWLTLMLAMWPRAAVGGDAGHVGNSKRQSDTRETRTMIEPVTLTSAISRSAKGLEIRYSVNNHSDKPLLVYNWTYEIIHVDTPDPYKLYRFVRGDSLQLLIGTAPRPSAHVFAGNTPHVIKLAPHATLDRQIVVDTPVREYNCYFSNNGFEIPAVTRDVELFVEYSGVAGVELDELPRVPNVFMATQRNAESPRKLLRSGRIPLELEVMKHTGKFSRMVLPEDR